MRNNDLTLTVKSSMTLRYLDESTQWKTWSYRHGEEMQKMRGKYKECFFNMFS